jgi:dTDP-L-rhamnose 4-epimerase
VKVLLTGAAGFIGTAIASELRVGGHEVVGVDLLIPQAHHGDDGAHANVHRLDVRSAHEDQSWPALLRGVDAVCHQAAMVGAGVTPADLPLYAGHNDLGTASLLSAMAAADVRRLLLASSMVVYGEGRYSCARHGIRKPPPRSRADLNAGRFDCVCDTCGSGLSWSLVPEDAELDPRSSYAASKVAQEHYARAWARQSDASAVALRYHNVYGPHMPKDTPYSGVAAIFRSQIESGQQPLVFEDGRQMRDFVHVTDVARANRLALESLVQDPPGHVRAYNIASGTPVSIADVAGLVARGAGTTAGYAVTGRYRDGDVRHVVASPELARRELGFRADVGPETGLLQFATAPLR